MDTILSHKKALPYLFIFCFLFRAVIIISFPQVYGLDSVANLSYKETIPSSYWFSLTHWTVFIFYNIFESISAIRFAFALIGSASFFTMYHFLKFYFSHDKAVIGSLFFNINPLFIFLTIVPYQEGAFILFLFLFLFFFCKKRYLIASLFFLITSLIRYEVILILPIWLFFLVKNRNSKNNYKAYFCILLCVILYLFYFIYKQKYFHSNISSFIYIKNYFKEYAFERRIQELFKILYWTFLYGTPLLLFGILGFINLEFNSNILKSKVILKVLIIWISATVISYPFIVEIGLINQRYSFLLILLLSITLPFGLSLFNKIEVLRVSRNSIISLLFILSGVYYIHRETTEIKNHSSFEISQFLNKHNDSEKNILVFTDYKNEYKDYDSEVFLQVTGQSTLPRKSFFLAHNYNLDNPQKLNGFIGKNEIAYIVNTARTKDLEKLISDLFSNYQIQNNFLYAKNDVEIYEITYSSY